LNGFAYHGFYQFWEIETAQRFKSHYTHNWGALKLKLNKLILKYAKCGLASACCKAGPSSNLGSVRDPTEVLLLLSEEAMRIQKDSPWRMVKDE
jgi:hypothetical protein